MMSPCSNQIKNKYIFASIIQDPYIIHSNFCIFPNTHVNFKTLGFLGIRHIFLKLCDYLSQYRYEFQDTGAPGNKPHVHAGITLDENFQETDNQKANRITAHENGFFQGYDLGTCLENGT
jgi:hypothetical protein